MAIYKLQLAKASDYAKDKNGVAIKSYTGSKRKLSAPYDKYGYLTGLDVKEEEFYEKALGLERGTLNRNHSEDDKTANFWDKWHVTIEDGRDTTFNDEYPLDALNIKLLRNHPNVGETIADADRPSVQYILTSEDHEAKVANDNRSWKVKAFMHYGSMTPEDKRNYLVASGKKVAGLSPDAIDKRVGDDVESAPHRFMETVMDKDLDLTVFVNDLLQAGILYRQGSAIVDKASGSTLAFRIEDVVDKFKEAENQPAYIQYQKELKAKRKAK